MHSVTTHVSPKRKRGHYVTLEVTKQLLKPSLLHHELLTLDCIDGRITPDLPLDSFSSETVL